ncbi:MAG: NUDIX domain-containing protein [Desulfuromonadaceae bacterium]|jgi:ADP-ribose pyrophosphatase YjhB (NUDIX family)
MGEQHSHCSYCGSPFADIGGWPRVCPACRKTSYRNPLPVVVVILPLNNGLVVVRRNIEPSKGTLTLPGGYLDLNETWQQGARRELLEETGIELAAEKIHLYDVQNGLDDTLVIFGLAEPQSMTLRPFRSKETQEVVLIDGPQELGFPNHTRIVKRYFSGRWQNQKKA